MPHMQMPEMPHMPEMPKMPDFSAKLPDFSKLDLSQIADIVSKLRRAV
jgi:hypothetical protein